MITKVRLSSGHIGSFDKQRIVDSLLKESKLIEKLNGHKKLTTKEANFIADDVEKIIDEHNIKYLSAPLIREIACASMLENDMEEVRRIYTRVGLPIFDLFGIITNPEIENANLVDNAETAHKYVADKVLKEAAMLLLPRHITEAHLSGDLHIHDLEYFCTRSFCADWDLRNFFFYGLDSSGVNKTNVAGPAKNAEVAILHASKALGSAQTNYAGGQGFYNFLTFISPYLKGRTEKEIRQLMQMFLYEISQTMVARGGQSLGKKEMVFVVHDEKIDIRMIGEFTDKMIEKYGCVTNGDTDICYLPEELDIKTISINTQTGMSEIKNIYAVSRHTPKNNTLLTVHSKSGSEITVTKDHSLYHYDDNGDLVTVVPEKMQCMIRNFSCPLPIKYEMGMILKSDYQRAGHINNSRQIDIPLDIKITPNFCKFMGLMVSDGSVNGNLIRISKNFPEITEFVNDFVHSEISSDITISTIGNSISFTNKGFATFLSSFFVNGASKKYAPDFVLYGDKQIKTEFINGYLSGDGTITNNGRMYFSTTSTKLIGHLHLLFSDLGIPYTPKDVRTVGEKVVIKDIETQRNYDTYEFEIPKKYTTHFNVIRTEINNNKIFDSIDQQRYDYFFLKNIIKSLNLDFDHSDYQLKSNTRKIKLNQIDGLLLRNPKYSSLFKKWQMNIPYEISKVIIHSSGLVINDTPLIPTTKIDYVYDLSVVDNENFITSTGILCHNTVFSSIQLTPGVPNLWKDKPSVYAGEVHHNEPYRIFEKEVRIAFKVLMELMMEGDYNGRPFNFPKPEIGFMKEFLVSRSEDKFYGTTIPTYDELYDKVFELTAKFGTPYFDNMIPQYRNNEEESVSCVQCCAYNFGTSQSNDDSFNDKLYFKNKIGFSMGAWQVVTINCPRLAYKSPTHEDFIENWKKMVDLSVEIFKEKKKFMDIQLAANRIPFAQQKPKNHKHQSKYSLVDFDKLVWEIGLLGMDDVVRYYTGKSMHESVDSFELAQYLCLEMKQVIENKAKETGMRLVFARTPAETTAQRFAVSDLINPLYTDSAREIVSGDLQKALELLPKTKDLPIYYTNGTHVPVSAVCTLIDRIKIEEEFFDILDGGNIHHIFIAEYNPDPKGLKEFTMGIIKNTKIGYFSFTKVLTACCECYHVAQGKNNNCINCGSTKVDYISRITGYLSNLKSWNEGKKEEFKNRHEYSLMR